MCGRLPGGFILIQLKYTLMNIISTLVLEMESSHNGTPAVVLVSWFLNFLHMAFRHTAYLVSLLLGCFDVLVHVVQLSTLSDAPWRSFTPDMPRFFHSSCCINPL